MRRALLGLLFSCALHGAEPRRVLFVTHSAGFRHDSIDTARVVVPLLSPQLVVDSTEDLSLLTGANLRNYDVLLFFTSGELALSAGQKADLLAFVRDGKGFGGVHSATDTLYSWPEYGDMIGAYFNGHPWAQEVSIDIEDPDHPAVRDLAPSFRIADEIYQFRDFSRDRVRVLMTLDVRSVNLGAEGVARTDRDFALAWCRNYGSGRVFYTALGHPDGVWLDPRFQAMLRNALLWLAGDLPGDAVPRPPRVPAIADNGIVNAASFAAGKLAPGSLFSIFGKDLSLGSTYAAPAAPLPKLAGTSVLLNGAPLPLLYVSPSQVNAYLPYDATSGDLAVASTTLTSVPQPIHIDPAAPGIFAVTRSGSALTIWATGLGAVEGSRTVLTPVVTVGGAPADVLFSGPSPQFPGVYQINVTIPAGLAGQVQVVVETNGARSNAVPFIL